MGSDHAATREVISPEAAAQVTKMMEMVTDEAEGTAPAGQGRRLPRGRQDRHRAGGRERQLLQRRSSSISFAGFAPADDPRFTVYVVIHNPEGDVGGGGTGGPAFRKIMAYLLQRYAVPPSGTPSPQLPIEWQPGAGRGR